MYYNLNVSITRHAFMSHFLEYTHTLSDPNFRLRQTQVAIAKPEWLSTVFRLNQCADRQSIIRKYIFGYVQPTCGGISGASGL
jgi:hypothetical protein